MKVLAYVYYILCDSNVIVYNGFGQKLLPASPVLTALTDAAFYGSQTEVLSIKVCFMFSHRSRCQNVVACLL